MRTIVFTTNNRHKLDEIRHITGKELHILSLADIDCREEIEETGTTLEENALIKARYVKEKYGYDCFADDTGLEVEVLGGAPGIYSARYAGESCNFDDNMNKLLAALKGEKNRRARFRTVIALLLNGETHYFEGVVEGNIIEKKRGHAGFGYDPIFVPAGYRQTFAELGDEIKNRISHRAAATRQLIRDLHSLPE